MAQICLKLHKYKIEHSEQDKKYFKYYVAKCNLGEVKAVTMVLVSGIYPLGPPPITGVCSGRVCSTRFAQLVREKIIVFPPTLPTIGLW